MAADAQASVKAGAHLGFDGVSAQVKAAAEVSVKAGVTNETKIGGVVISDKAEVYAAAKAEAKAEVDVTFNPFAKDGKIKAKAGLGAEASAGVGAELGGGLHSASGNGADAAYGFHLGKVGAKFDGDVEFKDGKLAVGLDFGASLGVGGSFKLAIKADIGQAAKNVGAAFAEIDSFGSAVGSPFRAVGGFFSGLFG